MDISKGFPGEIVGYSGNGVRCYPLLHVFPDAVRQKRANHVKVIIIRFLTGEINFQEGIMAKVIRVNPGRMPAIQDGGGYTYPELPSLIGHRSGFHQANLLLPLA